MPVLDNTDLSNIWGRDIDPGATTYSAGGAVWTILARTNAIANTQYPVLDGKLDDALDKLDDLETAVAAVSADMAYIKNKLDALTADPADPDQGHDHVIVAAVEWADAN